MKTQLTNEMLSRHSSLPLGKGLLQKKLLAIVLVVISSMLFTSETFAQGTDETIYKDWLQIGESSSHVDVSARIVKCSENAPNQVHLLIFNEGSSSSEMRFMVTVLNNETNESFSTNIEHTVARAEMTRANCSNDVSLNGLKFSLPANYNPNNLTISVTFN